MPGAFSRLRLFAFQFAACSALIVPPAPAEATPAMRERLVFAGPAASVTNPLIHMLESGALDDLARSTEFILWNNPDQLRALVIQGQVDFIAVPTNVAANLYNRGVPLTLLNVSTWDALWMISRTPGLQTLADFKGKEVAIPFRNDMPDIIFDFLAEEQGLDPQRDFQPRYTATPLDAVQLLITRRVDHALLAEPAVSMVLRKTQSFPVSLLAPELYRSVNLQEQWGELLGIEARIPQAGLAALGAARLDGELSARVEQAYAQSSRWCNENPLPCGEMVAHRIDLLDAQAVADSLQFQSTHYASAAQARPELETFFRLLLQRQPANLGGKLPEDGFYGEASAQK